MIFSEKKNTKENKKEVLEINHIKELILISMCLNLL